MKIIILIHVPRVVAYLGGSGDHVLDEVTMAGGVDDGDVVLGSLELPEGDINGDTTLTLGLQLVHDPGILEGALHTNVIQFEVGSQYTFHKQRFRATLNT